MNLSELIANARVGLRSTLARGLLIVGLAALMAKIGMPPTEAAQLADHVIAFLDYGLIIAAVFLVGHKARKPAEPDAP